MDTIRISKMVVGNAGVVVAEVVGAMVDTMETSMDSPMVYLEFPAPTPHPPLKMTSVLVSGANGRGRCADFQLDKKLGCSVP